jgi:hypothetical protein
MKAKQKLGKGEIGGHSLAVQRKHGSACRGN